MKPSHDLPASPSVNPPWWRVGMVWLVLGGPVAVMPAAQGKGLGNQLGQRLFAQRLQNIHCRPR